MNRYSSVRDLTMTQRPSGGGVGSDTRTRWMCGCITHRRPGAIVINGLRLKCDGCANKGKA